MQHSQQTLKSILNHIQGILLLALNKGVSARRPWNTQYSRKEERKSVAFHMRELDELLCPWLIQNLALEILNDVNDEQKVYERLYKKPLILIAEEIYNEGAKIYT